MIVEHPIEMFNPLVVPSSFFDSWTVEEQIVYLAENAQGKLVAGNNITITPNEDGTYTISATGGGGGGTGATYRIRQNPNPAETSEAEYYLQNMSTMEQSGVTIVVPKTVGVESIITIAGTDKETVTITLTNGTVQSFDIPYGRDGRDGADGAQGVPGVTPDITVSGSVLPMGGSAIPIVRVTKSGTAENPNFDFEFANLKGEKGDKGEKGEQGEPGAPASVPNITVSGSISPIASSAAPVVTVTKSGTDMAPNFDFEFANLKGAQGDRGSDGVSPTITVREITGGHQIEIVSVGGTERFDVMDGTDGEDGQAGTPGATGATPNITVSGSISPIAGSAAPIVTVTKSGTAENPNFDFLFANLKGEKGDTGAAGQNGTNGTDGVSPTVTVRDITGGHQIEIVSAGGTETFDVMDGTDGQDGHQGATGATPNITVSGSISPIAGSEAPIVTVTKSGTAENPNFDFLFANLKGDKGDTGAAGQNGTNGTDGVSPTVTVRDITGGHQIEIVSAGGTETFDVMDGTDGQQGTPGATGATPNITVSGSISPIAGSAAPIVTVTKSGTAENPHFDFDFANLKGEKGDNGVGIPSGGTAGQILTKNSATDYDARWGDAPSGMKRYVFNPNLVRPYVDLKYHQSDTLVRISIRGFDNVSGLYFYPGSFIFLRKDNNRISVPAYDDRFGSIILNILWSSANRLELESIDYSGDQVIDFRKYFQGSLPFGSVEAIGKVPSGGTTGQVLRKTDGSSYNYTWSDIPTPDVFDDSLVTSKYDCANANDLRTYIFYMQNELGDGLYYLFCPTFSLLSAPSATKAGTCEYMYEIGVSTYSSLNLFPDESNYLIDFYDVLLPIVIDSTSGQINATVKVSKTISVGEQNVTAPQFLRSPEIISNSLRYYNYYSYLRASTNDTPSSSFTIGARPDINLLSLTVNNAGIGRGSISGKIPIYIPHAFDSSSNKMYINCSQYNQSNYLSFNKVGIYGDEEIYPIYKKICDLSDL